MSSEYSKLKPNMIVRGPILPEPVQVIVTIPMRDSIKLIGKGLRTGQVHEPILSPEQLATLEATPEIRAARNPSKVPPRILSSPTLLILI